MIDLSKSYEFFQPEKEDARINIVGCGSVGSTIAVLLARAGVTKMTLWDFDMVEPHNLANQMFRQCDVGKLKTEALADILAEINPDIRDDLQLKSDGWNGQQLSGYVFLCVDSIELRREIVEKFFDSPYIRAMFDFRTRLTDAQHYAADWSDYKKKKNFLSTMEFSHEEAAEETPEDASQEGEAQEGDQQPLIIPETRMEILHNMERLLVAEEAAAVPLWQYRQTALEAPGLSGVVSSPLGYRYFQYAAYEAPAGDADSQTAQ